MPSRGVLSRLSQSAKGGSGEGFQGREGQADQLEETEMTITVRQIRLLASTPDSQGKPNAPITVIGTRANLRADFKPAKRGAPLVCGTHELRLVKRAKKGELQSYDWVTP